MKKKRLRVGRYLINLERELKDFPIEFGSKNKILIRKDNTAIKEISIEGLNLKEIKERIQKELAS